MTCREKLTIEHPEHINPKVYGGCNGCPSDYGYLPDPPVEDCGGSEGCNACWNRGIPDNSPITILTCDGGPMKSEPVVIKEGPCILDSGNRREFETGAVRDIQEGKGRCDLLPLDVVADYLEDTILLNISRFVSLDPGCKTHLENALWEFSVTYFRNRLNRPESNANMLLEVAKHFEEGCKKYGENNWQKGIPVRCYIDSAVRHYLKFLRGDKDEPHDRAFCWNILCAIWTCKHKPELNDYAKKEDSENAG